MTTANNLPPKTCSIERMVTKEKDVEKVVKGIKTETRRNGRYADIGEIMDLDGHKFIVKNVYSQLLGDVTEADAYKEGYDNLEAYKDSILSFHPGMRWAPKMQVWVHEFDRVQSLRND